MEKGKVLIIDDSALVRNYLFKLISGLSNFELFNSASNGEIGIKKILSYKPDIVILDLEMDQGDGLYVLQQIEQHMPQHERPFVLLYSSRAKHGDPVFKKAIEFGFCDFILKVEGSIETIMAKLRISFVEKLNAGLEAKRSRSALHGTKAPVRNIEITKPNPTLYSNITELPPTGINAITGAVTKKPIAPKILVIGASTGGPFVIRQILKELGPIPIPIVIIQHMPEGFTKSFANELAHTTGITVHELKHNMSLNAGEIYIFPGGTHGHINAYGNLFVYNVDRKDYPNHPFKPSIDLALERLSNSLQGSIICVILTGMGKDGAIGAKKFSSKGSLVLVQDRDSSVVWGMPGAAVQAKAADVMLSQDELSKGIKHALRCYGII